MARLGMEEIGWARALAFDSAFSHGPHRMRSADSHGPIKVWCCDVRREFAYTLDLVPPTCRGGCSAPAF